MNCNYYKLKNGKDYVIRKAKTEDAEKLLEYLNTIPNESDNLTFGPNELTFDIEERKAFINTCENCESRYFVIAEYEGKIIGNLNFSGETKPRTKHKGEFGVSVLKEFWGNGIAYELIKGLIQWAKEGGKIKKINLLVREDNERAVKVYKKLGFEVEGLIKRSFFIDGRYYSAYYMGLIID
jgi:RimJ/RimL family protein N-acetyltransferase